MQLADGSVVQWLSDAKDSFIYPSGIEVKGAEAAALIQTGVEIYGANLTINEYGVPLFGDFFFSAFCEFSHSALAFVGLWTCSYVQLSKDFIIL